VVQSRIPNLTTTVVLSACTHHFTSNRVLAKIAQTGARSIWLAEQGLHVPAIAATRRLTQATVRLWLKRLNATGVAGLEDPPRAGRPPERWQR